MKIKKIKSNNSNPSKKWKRKSSRIIIQENANISNNQKSYTLILKESRIAPHHNRKKSNTIKSKKIDKRIIDINLKSINILFYNDFELNSMDYSEVLNIYKRTFLQYYLSLLKAKTSTNFSFLSKKGL